MMFEPWSGLAIIAIALGGVAAAARADSIFELEHARGNARAGGPVSEVDAELLHRWGALSGTPGWRNTEREFYAGEASDNEWRTRSQRRHQRN